MDGVVWMSSARYADGSVLATNRILRASAGFREENEFVIQRHWPDGRKHFVCKVGENGIPKEWSDAIYPSDREEVVGMLDGLKDAILVALVSDG